jgi:hypothetical protein
MFILPEDIRWLGFTWEGRPVMHPITSISCSIAMLIRGSLCDDKAAISEHRGVPTQLEESVRGRFVEETLHCS